MSALAHHLKVLKKSIVGKRAYVALPLLTMVGHPVMSEVPPWDRPTLNFMGVPGIFDMPTAYPMSDADLSLAVSSLGGTYRGALHFQINKRLSGVFRYSRVNDFSNGEDFYDRSFDMRFLLSEETKTLPEVSVGMQDFGGTGVYAAEYIVATKTIGRFRATGGIGWGRLGSYNGFSNPLSFLEDSLEERPEFRVKSDEAGKLDTGSWFHGDAAFFGGLQYKVNERITLSAEYSSDAYSEEVKNAEFSRKTPINIGGQYNINDQMGFGVAWLYGSTLTVGLNYTFNPKEPNKHPGGLDRAPRSVAVRPSNEAASKEWNTVGESSGGLEQSVRNILEDEGMLMDRLKLHGDKVLLSIRIGDQTFPSQALGRTSRSLTHVLPQNIETFEITLVTRSGMPVSEVLINRSDVEELEYAPDGGWKIFARSDFFDATRSIDFDVAYSQFPRFSWSLSPYLSAAYFDISNPLRLSFGAALQASFEPSAGFVLEGVVLQEIAENISGLPNSDSTLPHVRTDVNRYAEAADLSLGSLTATKYFRPREEIFGRLSLGYFEPMFGGISGEVLWKPVDSRFGVGFEMNYAKKRAYDQGFEFQDYEVITGHASVYYDAPGDFHYQIDAGRYLAGDWGGTISIDREFDNGITIGAFATLTDVSFDDFGEGAFDKGIRVNIPISALTGVRSDQAISRTIRPIRRDGGARMDVSTRLYEQVRQYQTPDLQDTWGRFWR